MRVRGIIRGEAPSEDGATAATAGACDGVAGGVAEWAVEWALRGTVDESEPLGDGPRGVLVGDDEPISTASAAWCENTRENTDRRWLSLSEPRGAASRWVGQSNLPINFEHSLDTAAVIEAAQLAGAVAEMGRNRLDLDDDSAAVK